MAQKLTTTPTAGLSPRGVDGLALEGAWDSLRRTLSARLGTGHALLFAQPVRSGQGIEWQTAAEGAAMPLAQADPARRGRAGALIARHLADIAALVARLGGEAGSGQQTARMLAAIARPPPPGDVWLVGEQPVIIRWTHDPAAPVAARPAPPPPAAARATAAWAASAAAVLVLAVLGFLSLAPPWAAAQAGEAARLAGLQKQLAQLSTVDIGICRAPR